MIRHNHRPVAASRFRVRSAALAALLPSMLAAGCRAADRMGPACSPRLPGHAVAVVVRDAATGAPLADGARGAVRDGAFIDSLRPESPQAPVQWTLVGGGERAGTYTVTVERQGARPWRRDGVVVHRGACGVVTETLTADLEPSA